MAKFISSEMPDNAGERAFVERAMAYLDDSYVIYWNREHKGLQSDLCILMPGKGVLVVEVKGWREETVLRVENGDAIVIRTDSGEALQAPQKQVRSYRLNIRDTIKEKLGRTPLVTSMVCLTQISRAYFRRQRLDVVLDESVTMLKEDLEQAGTFFQKLDQVLSAAQRWKSEPFDARLMLQVRGLFEAGIDLDDVDGMLAKKGRADSDDAHDYSRFSFFDAATSLDGELEEMVRQYMLGCKLYCVFSTPEQLEQAAAAIDQALTDRGLVREKEELHLVFDRSARHTPQRSGRPTAFTAFHCAFSLLGSPLAQPLASFSVRDGKLFPQQKEWLRQLSDRSAFNAEQYFVEHAAPGKNVLIRAGAGTGKTHTMIDRVSYICHTQSAVLQDMADRIVMLTFTNEAAGQMATKLKAYFRNCYLLTLRAEYLSMVARIDHMQISTIDSYVKKLIAQLGTEFGYGVDVGITSSDFHRRRKIADLVDQYVAEKKAQLGPQYVSQLGLPIYAIQELILNFIEKLHNKNISVPAVTRENFGTIPPDEGHQQLHELLAAVIPCVEREYAGELLEHNQIHLQSMMSLLSRYISDPNSQARIRELKKVEGARQFMFVDEFQDTDDTQIALLMTLARLLDYKLFVVGDVKQCIYRFRGAEEDAFDRLDVKNHRDEWVEDSLQRNYRTDTLLLDQFHRSFSAWGSSGDELLIYHGQADRLLGTRDYNSALAGRVEEFYRRIPIQNETQRIPALAREVRRLQKRIEEELQSGKNLSDSERKIAILVRENWQADVVRTECARLGISVQTSTGGDLYMSPPALDMMTLVNALVHFDEADYLYNLAQSNFFRLNIPRSSLYAMREKLRAQGWRSKLEEREQSSYLILCMNHKFLNMEGKEKTWEDIVRSLRTKPILQVLREIYNALEPWKNYSKKPGKQHDYQLNVDLLFERLINACNIDRLTINTLQEHLYSCIVSKVAVDRRTAGPDKNEADIQCITVHKSKGLEYGHVILPYCSASMDYIKKAQLHVSTAVQNGQLQIGYSINMGATRPPLQNEYYDVSLEKEEKRREETRILYVAMTRAIRSFSWIDLEGKKSLCWQNLIGMEG